MDIGSSGSLDRSAAAGASRPSSSQELEQSVEAKAAAERVRSAGAEQKVSESVEREDATSAEKQRPEQDFQDSVARERSRRLAASQREDAANQQADRSNDGVAREGNDQDQAVDF